MKQTKILIYTLLSLFLMNIISCKKEVKIESSNNANYVYDNNSKSSLIIDETNYMSYISDPDVKFFFQDLSILGIENEKGPAVATLCVDSKLGTLCRDFKSSENACLWGVYCQHNRPFSYWNYTINGLTMDCFCWGIGCLTK
jgi:hypothetical protein